MIDIREPDEHATGVASAAVQLLYNSQNRSAVASASSRYTEGRN